MNYKGLKLGKGEIEWKLPGGEVESQAQVITQCSKLIFNGLNLCIYIIYKMYTKIKRYLWPVLIVFNEKDTNYKYS